MPDGICKVYRKKNVVCGLGPKLVYKIPVGICKAKNWPYMNLEFEFILLHYTET